MNKQELEKRFAAAFAQSEAQEQRQAEVDVAVKAASNGAKMIGPLLTAIVSMELDMSKASGLMVQALKRSEELTRRVIESYGIKSDEAPQWARATVQGEIIQVLTSALAAGNSAVLQDDAEHLITPLIQGIKGVESAALPSTPTSSPENQLINALMQATSTVMAEYTAFSYFHTDDRKMAEEIGQFFSNRVIDGTLQELVQRFRLTEGERAYFGVTMLKQAGELMAQQWKTGIPNTINGLKQLPTEQRRKIQLQGYPLDHIIKGFDNVYQALEISFENAMRTLAPNREHGSAQPTSAAKASMSNA